MLTRRKSVATSSLVHRSNTDSAKISKDNKLKLLLKDEIEPVKRSSRIKRRTCPDEPESPIKRNRKRKNETTDLIEDKKLKTSKKSQKEQVKAYCWICHKLSQGQTCTCKRVYHNECLEKSSTAFENNKCPECQLKSVNGTELTRPFIDGLKVYLEYTTKWIVEEHMLNWPQNSDIIPDIDIEILLKKVKSNSYKTTAEFYGDVKWFYHDCCVLYGEHSKQSKDMKKIVKEVKEELFDIEACPECYYYLYIHKSDDSDFEDSENVKNSTSDKFFVRLCNPPHDIVWAKVSGYSHFPAKCLKIINGKARVRFFGKHEKSDIPINTIFRISQAHPMYEYRNITDTESRTSLEYTYAKGQLLKYIKIYEENVGHFQFFGFRVFYEPDNVDSKTGIETQEPGFSDLPTTSPTPILSPICEATIPSSNNDMSINMTFCVDTSDDSTSPLVPASHIQGFENAVGQNTSSENPFSPFAETNAASARMSPASSPGSVSILSTCNAANSRDFQIKQECDLANQIRSLAESSNETPTNIIQIFKNILIGNSSFSATEGNTSSSESCLENILRNCYSHNDSGRTISPSVSSPHLPIIIKEENFDSLPSTSGVYQPPKQININSTENASTSRDQQLPEPEVGSSSSNCEITVIDLTEEEDSSANMKLSNIFGENPRIQKLFECTRKAVDTFVTRLCEEVIKQQAPEPNQMCQKLTKKLDDTEKKFQEETEKLRDEIKRLQKKLDPEK